MVIEVAVVQIAVAEELGEEEVEEEAISSREKGVLLVMLLRQPHMKVKINNATSQMKTRRRETAKPVHCVILVIPRRSLV